VRRALALAGCAAALGLAAADARAQGAPCRIGLFDAASSTFFLDTDGDGIWHGTAGGDREVAFDPAGGASLPIVGDWNGDGVDDVGTLRGTVYRLDLDGDGIFEDAAGGDRNASFAPSFGEGVPIAGDWDGDGDDEIGTYLDAERRFLLDANGNGVWDGQAGGDVNVAFAAFAGSGTPLVGDWDGDDDDDLGRYVHQRGSPPRFYLDANGNRVWDGTGGGDATADPRGQRGPWLPLIGDWNRDGRDETGAFSRYSERYGVDLDGDGFSGGNAESFAFAISFPAGDPLVCDWDADGTTNLGKVNGNVFRIDANANGSWDGNAQGDRGLAFTAPGPTPVVGRWALAPP
jgi:hypothetical protein